MKKSLVQRFKEQHRGTQALIAGTIAGVGVTGLAGGASLLATRGKFPRVRKASNVRKNVSTMGGVSKAQKKAASDAAVRDTQKTYREAMRKARKDNTTEEIRRKLDDPNHVWKF